MSYFSNDFPQSSDQYNMQRQESFESQGSLGVIASLQDQDRKMHATMADFMEETIDLGQYIGSNKGCLERHLIYDRLGRDYKDLACDDCWEDVSEQDDPKRNVHIVQHQMALEEQYHLYPEYPLYEQPAIHSTSIKREAEDDFDFVTSPSNSSLSYQNYSTPAPVPAPVSVAAKEDPQKALENFKPTIKPRKYSLKPEEEKKNPTYVIKRAKNNDAVRKSRNKAKEQQKLKEDRLNQLEQEVDQLRKKVEEKTVEENRMREEIIRLRGQVANCRCRVMHH